MLFLPILLRVNAYQCCIPFCFSTEQNRTNRVDWVRLGSVIELNRTHKKVPVRLCSIAEPIELQSKNSVRLGSIGFWFGFVRLATPGLDHALSMDNVCYRCLFSIPSKLEGKRKKKEMGEKWVQNKETPKRKSDVRKCRQTTRSTRSCWVGRQRVNKGHILRDLGKKTTATYKSWVTDRVPRPFRAQTKILLMIHGILTRQADNT